MPIRSNLHTHSIYCDGTNSLSEMVVAAIAKGFRSIGFSGHAYLPFDPGCCMSPTGTLAYRAEVRRLQQEYAGVIDIFLGLENDGLMPQPTDGYDYVIGSVHNLYAQGKYHTVDNTPAHLQACIDEGYGGSVLHMAQAYYDLLVSYTTTQRVDIVGHFDLIQKLNGGNRFFDPDSPAYRRIALDALDTIAKTGKIFEVNTGAISRGYLKDPYPAVFLLKRLLELKAPIIISSDSHAVETIDAQFDVVSAMLYDMGFRETMELVRKKGFVPVPLC